MKVLFILLAPVLSLAFEVPSLTGPVVDQAGLLSYKTQQVLNRALHDLNAKGVQIQVLTVPSVDELSIEQASIKVTDKWKLGNKEQDKGVLFMIAKNEKKVRIEVGQGLEGVLTDAHSRRIIDESVVPLFKSGEFDSGILMGTYLIAKEVFPDEDIKPYFSGAKISRRGSTNPLEGKMKLLALLLFFGGFFLLRLFGGGLNHRRGFGGGGPWIGGGGFGGGGSSWSGGGGGFSGGGASGGW